MQRSIPWHKSQGFRVFIVFVILSMLLTACLGDNGTDNQNDTPRGTVSVQEATPGAGNASNATAAVPSGSTPDADSGNTGQNGGAASGNGAQPANTPASAGNSAGTGSGGALL